MIDFSWLHKLSMKEALTSYNKILDQVKGTENYYPMLAELGKQDRFFLLVYLLHRPDVIHPWIYDRCREVEADPNGHIDLWARYHYKSTIVTFAGAIQEIIRNPEITICILSYNNATATDFLIQIKRELEGNEDLQKAYPDIFYENPKRESPTWSLEKGLIVKRKSNPRESTISAYGLVDNQPTGRHFMLRIYDDVVTKDSVTTGNMIEKVNEAWELSLNLGAGKQGNAQWYVGTRYNADDTYKHIIGTGLFPERRYPATHDGTPDGDPVFLSEQEWEEIKQATSEYVLACQQLLNPMAGSQREFKDEWIRNWEVRPYNLNVYILCDPASSKKGSACNTAMIVIGVDALWNKYLLDGYCHKMDLNERWENLKHLRNKWVNAPGIQTVQVGYERYALQTDQEHFELMMKIERNFFPITEVSWTRDGSHSKDDRIRRLIPDHKNWKFFYPETKKITKRMNEAHQNNESFLVAKPIKRKNHDNKIYELTDWFFRNEFAFFPHSQAKDMLDAMSRLYDMDMTIPMIYNSNNLAPHDFMANQPSFYMGQSMEPEAEWV